MDRKKAKQVVVIDDAPDVRKILEINLKGKGFDVFTAEDGEKGLEIVRDEKIDLIILDVLMPRTDGFLFLKTLRNDPSIPDIPILMLTARAAMKDTFEAFNVDGFETKPINMGAILEKVGQLLQDKAMIVSDNGFVIDKVSPSLEKAGYEVHMVKNEAEMSEKGSKTRFKVIVVHLPFISMDPDQFVQALSGLRYRSPQVFIYCDSDVKGTETNDTVVIDEIRVKWKKAGIEAFFDARLTGPSFMSLFKSWVGGA
ncbi:MAG: response regulator [Candidatus Omnitrophica bacterium]|nr:response regulator [Candidatus Omnitrophota bacterium]MDD5488077.1 response regulator [Candidatus Omnitrophota bacterium]